MVYDILNVGLCSDSERMYNMKFRKFYLPVIICILMSVLSACGDNVVETMELLPPEVTLPIVTTTEPPVPEDSMVHLTAAGDNLIHSSIYKQAQARATDGGYDFDFAYEHIKPLINGDINILNQETPICNDIFEPSTYPCFNSPTQLGDKMLSLGFNVFNHANNHILDRGVKGTEATLDYWASKNAIVCGAYRNEEDMNDIRLRTQNDITFSFLGFTEHTNGLKVREGSDVKVIYTSDLETIEKQITEAKKLSDVVVVSVHWGVENSHIITDAQRGLAQKMADWGADIIIGTHPHVIQDMEFIKRNDGTPVLVAYSLGNFISAQDVNNRMIGGVLDFNVRKNGVTEEITIEDVKFIPVVTHYDWGFADIRVYPFSEYTKELADAHGVRAKSDFSYDFIVKTLTDNISKEFLVMDLG